LLKSWVPPFEQALTHPRFRGLMKLVGGLLAGAVVYLITWGIGALTGFTAVNALIGLPFAVSMIGLMEIVIGINFADLENLFSRGGFFLKIGIPIVVLFFVAIYLAGAIRVYRTYYQYY
jgi:hypothetical protein